MSGPVEPRRRTPARPYANKRGGPVSVTTCNVLDKHLDWAAARETAMFAVHHQHEWAGLDPDDAVERVRRHFRGLWDGRAGMGTLVHAVNEAWTWGEDVDLAALVTQMAHADRRPIQVWQGVERETVDMAQGYVNGLERFWIEWQPITVATEEVVRYTGDLPYIGQRDWTADLADTQRWLLDLKTTAQADETKGIYADSWRLQLAAYRHATEIVVYDDAGNEEATHPNYPVDRCGIVLLRGDDTYTFYEVQAGEAEWDRFMQLRALYEWVARESKVPAPLALAPQGVTV